MAPNKTVTDAKLFDEKVAPHGEALPGGYHHVCVLPVLPDPEMQIHRLCAGAAGRASGVLSPDHQTAAHSGRERG